MKKKYLYFLLIISFLLFFVSTLNITLWFYDHKATLHLQKITQEYSNIHPINSNNELTNPPKDITDSTWLYVNEPFLEISFNKLLVTNSDTVAYIKISGTDISYPIVKSSDNAYYLNHSFDQSKNKAGWPFLDYRNNFETLSDNTIIYGHARNDGTMFGTLKNLLNSEWFADSNNHLIKISSPISNYIFQIFSVYTIPEESYYLKTFFPTTNEFQDFIKTIQQRSIYDFNTVVNYNDRLLTISTCYNTSGTRTVVHAKLIKKIPHT